ncbi:putative bifunctional diguanylate cyclase/phosphodiesterase [Brevibacillus ginsengisoli]|uniref:putative bifunctional diguanylate cyclase/phosphodiesterase n=1 Tax=Brevibacillus ginsengisoli TaxID=363854 RepID=UPI003CF5EC19
MQMDFLIFNISVLAIFILMGAWMYYRIHKEKLGIGLGFRRHSVMGKVPIYVALSLILTLFIGGFLISEAEEQRYNEFARNAGGLTPTFAYDLQLAGHSMINIGTNPNDPIYRQVRENMNRWLLYNPYFTDLYTLRKTDNGTIYFVVDSKSYRSDDGIVNTSGEQRNAHVGIYYNHIPEVDLAFEGVVSIEKHPTYDQRGYTISAFAPIYNDKGAVEAIVGLDYDGKQWEREVQLERLKVMGFLLVPVGLIFLMYWLIFRYRIDKIVLHYHQDQLEKSEERFRKLSNATFEAILIHRNGITIEVNESFTYLFGYTREEAIGMDVLTFAVLEDRDLVYRKLLSGIESPYEVKGLRKDQSEFYVEIVGKVIDYNGSQARVTAIRDVTARKEAEHQIHHMAYHDDLTNLSNRKRFLETLGIAVSEAEENGTELAVMFLDLDRFKVINDSFGHYAGDQLLKIIANRLRCAVTDEATIARLGGDEFTILLPRIDGEEQVERIAHSILDGISQPVEVAGRELTISVSIGICRYPLGGRDGEELMKNADTAMYRAKEKGRNNYQFYTKEMNEQAYERLALEQDLRKAIDRNELLLHYQPQVDMGTGQIVGVEALLRWKHPIYGMVSPARFIPLAEETQLIISIGEWVLQTACRQNKRWQKAGYQLKVAVNLSASQFQHGNLISMVSEVLRESQLEPQYLELEITESIAMKDVDRVIETLNQLTQLGIVISIDDFGTGYSSMNYLKHFPINRLKIDQSFVHDITTDLQDAAIADSIIAMAHSLGLKVIAEGVETADQLEHLRRKKCDEIQGFYLSRPLSADDLEELLSHQAN